MAANLIYTFSCGSIASCHVCTTRAACVCARVYVRAGSCVSLVTFAFAENRKEGRTRFYLKADTFQAGFNSISAKKESEVQADESPRATCLCGYAYCHIWWKEKATLWRCIPEGADY